MALAARWKSETQSASGGHNLTWERLAELGVNRDGALRVEYNRGNRGGGERAEFKTPFGREKGKTLDKVEDLAWYLKAYKENVADPGKARFREANEKIVAAIEAEIARRKGAVRAPSETSAKTAAVTPWEQVKSLCAGAGVLKPAEFTKAITGKDHSSRITDEDVEKVRAALALRAHLVVR